MISLSLLAAIFFPVPFRNIADSLRDAIGMNFGWYYLLLITAIICVCILGVLSPAGKIRLGDPGSKPEYSMISWFSMLFSAGMGIGLVFYGAAEPLSHFAMLSPTSATFSRKALEEAFTYSFLHYGIHAWSIYVLVALALAYFQFRKKEKTLLSVVMKPLFGSRMDGLFGKIVDSMTIFATVVGVSTTLGLGAAQINGGLHFLFGIPRDYKVQVIIIVVSTVLFLISALSGIRRGVKILSNLNVLIAVVLMAMAFIVGPHLSILNTFVDTLGAYFNNFIELSLRTGNNSPSEQAWIQHWTIFYWSWWLSWSPFVGIFIARISKGRTIRQFITYVLLLPTLFSFLWFSVFGTLSTNAAQTFPQLANLHLEQILFETFKQYPFTDLMSVMAIFLIFSFFITSADSATFVLSMESENGILEPDNVIKVLWGITLSLIAIILMFVGGLNTLQDVMIIVAFPFSFIIILVMISLVKELRYEKNEMGLYIKPDTYPTKDEPFRSYENNDT